MNYTKANKKELTILLVGVGGGGCCSGSAQKQQQQELPLAHLLPPRARTAGESPYPPPLRSLDAFSSPNLSTSQKKALQQPGKKSPRWEEEEAEKRSTPMQKRSWLK
jgi:hypothetical protein